MSRDSVWSAGDSAISNPLPGDSQAFKEIHNQMPGAGGASKKGAVQDAHGQDSTAQKYLPGLELQGAPALSNAGKGDAGSNGP
jgi:hypothetical protein